MAIVVKPTGRTSSAARNRLPQWARILAEGAARTKIGTALRNALSTEPQEYEPVRIIQRETAEAEKAKKAREQDIYADPLQGVPSPIPRKENEIPDFTGKAVMTFGRAGQFEHVLGTRKGEPKLMHGGTAVLGERVLYGFGTRILNKLLGFAKPYVKEVIIKMPMDAVKDNRGQIITPATDAIVTLVYSDGLTFFYNGANINRIYKRHGLNIGIYRDLENVPKDPGRFDANAWLKKNVLSAEKTTAPANGKLEPAY